MATTVLLFYKYADISGKVPEVAQWQKELCTRLKLEGRILLADEGINGSLSGPAEVVQQYCDALSTSEYFAKAHAEEPIDFKTSTTDEQVLFPGLSVKQVASICGGGNIAKAPLELGGKHLTPREWHEALQRQEADNAVLLDCRNDYEYAIGRFQGAVDPGTRHFHEFADYVDKHKDQWKKQGKKVLMYCTGGIRCEKASAYIRAQGIDDVNQLKGGIHRYLEEFPDTGGLWRGRNFVFDARVSMAPAGLDAPATGGKPEDNAAAEKGPEIVGRCSIGCGKPCNKLSGNNVCCVCKDLVLICDPCDEDPKNADLFCHRHGKFRGLLHSQLGQFSVAELKDQLKALQDLRNDLKVREFQDGASSEKGAAAAAAGVEASGGSASAAGGGGSVVAADDASEDDNVLLKATGHGRYKNKSQRRMLRRQIQRVEAQIAHLMQPAAAGEGASSVAPLHHHHDQQLVEVPPHFKPIWGKTGETTTADGSHVRWCRACGVVEPQHNGPLGSCWGMWTAHALETDENGKVDENELEKRRRARQELTAARVKAAEEKKAAKKRKSAEAREEYIQKREAKSVLAAAKKRRMAERREKRERALRARLDTGAGGSD